MTEAAWLMIGAAVVVTIVLSFGSIFLSNRGVKRLERLQAARRSSEGSRTNI